MTSMSGPVENATASVTTANEMTLARSAVRRPILSPNIPPNNPPNIIPKGPANVTQENASSPSPQAIFKAGIVGPISWLSTPSRMIVSAVPKMSSFW